ncbi:MAG: HNH endonuclease [Stenotrophomonas sp.]
MVAISAVGATSPELDRALSSDKSGGERTGSPLQVGRGRQPTSGNHGCGTSIDRSNSPGDHVERHADGGPTTSSNHAEVCLDCHKQLRERD